MDEWLEWAAKQTPAPTTGTRWLMREFPPDDPIWFEVRVEFVVGNSTVTLTGGLHVDVRVPWPEGEAPDSASGYAQLLGPEPTPDSKPTQVTITVDFDGGSVYRSDEATARAARAAWGLVDSYGDSPMTATMHLDGVTYTAEFDMPPLDPLLWFRT